MNTTKINPKTQTQLIQKNSQKQNRQQVSFGAVDYTALKEITPQINNIIKEGTILGQVAKALEQINPHAINESPNCLTKAAKKFTKLLHKYGFDTNAIKISEKGNLEFHSETPIPSKPMTLTIKNYETPPFSGNSTDKHTIHFIKKAAITVAEDNLYTKMLAGVSDSAPIKQLTKAVPEKLKDNPSFIIKGHSETIIPLDFKKGPVFNELSYIKTFKHYGNNESEEFFSRLIKGQETISRITKQTLEELELKAKQQADAKKTASEIARKTTEQARVGNKIAENLKNLLY
ncbi:MAG TPA: hypothetical protein DDW90_11120 [Cyanobacteria bacterium UBA9971]|nr:hypothetical protein [Cyanobacteria bacterium UBA9971]